MINSITDYIAESVCLAPYGLIIVAGPKDSGKTHTMRAIESAVSKMERGRYFRIGETPPEDGSPVHFIETCKGLSNSDELTDEEVTSWYNQFIEWERNVVSEIFKPAPAAVFLDNLDKGPAGRARIVVDIAQTTLLTVVSMETDSIEQAWLNICGAAQIDSGPDSPLAPALNSVIFQTPSINPETGDKVIEVEIAGMLGPAYISSADY